jgi:hypothetical protein
MISQDLRIGILCQVKKITKNAVKRHVRFVYKEANPESAKDYEDSWNFVSLDLSRHLPGLDHK